VKHIYSEQSAKYDREALSRLIANKTSQSVMNRLYLKHNHCHSLEQREAMLTKLSQRQFAKLCQSLETTVGNTATSKHCGLAVCKHGYSKRHLR